MFARTLASILTLGMLTACASTESLETLRSLTPTGDPYQIALVTGYTTYAEELAGADEGGMSNYFAEKGLRAIDDADIEPESPEAWKMDEPPLKELSDAREQLMKALETNRTTQPELAASAMIAYDRWLIAHQSGAVDEVKQARYETFANARMKLGEAHVASVSAPPPPPSVPSESNRTVLYFPYDSDHLGDSALAALKKLASSIAGEDSGSIAINGHADRAGSDDYNMRLSERRAVFVKKALEKTGVDAKHMKHFAFGESDPAVATDDGVKEPKNRRVEITVE